MRHYGVFDADGTPQGFWNDDIYPPQEDGSRNAKIPTEAVEISEQVWIELLNNQHLTRYIDGEVIHLDPPPPPEQERPPDYDVLLDHENRILMLEGQPPMTQQDFRKKHGL